MEEKRLDELLNEEMTMNEEEIKRTEKIINKKMNQRIFGRSLTTSIAVVLLAVCMLLGLLRYHDYIQDKNSFHLSDWEMVVEVDEFFEMDEKRLEVMNAYAYINSYVALFCPGFIATKDQVKQFELNKLDYGSYEIEAELINLFNLSAADGNITNVDSQQTLIPISWSNIWIEDTNKHDLIETRYQTYRQNGWTLGRNSIPEEETKTMKEETEKLPETSIVMLDITLKNPMTLTEILEYQKEHLDSRVVYVTTHVSDEYVEPYGFSLFEGWSIVDVNDDYQDEYPSLLLSGKRPGDRWISTNKAYFWHSLPDYDEEMLIDHYLSCMKLLVNNDAAKWYEEDLIKIIADVEENGVSVKGFRIYATQDDALELFENENVKSIVLQDVKLSKYQK